MRKFRKLGVCALSAVLAFGCCFTACAPDEEGNGEQTYNPETRPLTMSIGALDGNFNPFFYTAQNDGTIVGMTQVSMLTTDASGQNVKFGEDVPTVAKDFKEQEVGEGENKTTKYSFLIKNGMKYSDGNDLTIMDVLFNFYVYLDQAYLGSNTLYSTDIQGLKAYHAQDPNVADDYELDTSKYYALASGRLDDVVSYCDNEGAIDEEQVKKDILTLIKMFKEEVETDWTSMESSFASRDLNTYEYRFTEPWEAYLFNAGIVRVQTGLNEHGATVALKDADGKYLTDLDEEGNTYASEIEEYATNAGNLKEYTDKGASAQLAKEYCKRDWAIQMVYTAKTGVEDINDLPTSVDGVNLNKQGMIEIIGGWATGSNALERFAAEERYEEYEGLLGADGLLVKTISGITARRTKVGLNGEQLTEAHDVLEIVINDVDPKAKWNFSIPIAPMHYYSEPDLVAEAEADYQTYKSKFEQGQTHTLTKFGVKFNDPDFFNDGGLQKGDKTSLPLGAGAYKASKASGGATEMGGFHSNKFVYFERNTYFETMGAELENAIIKTVKFAEIGDDKVITALKNEEIDYGMPSGNAKNAAEINNCESYLASVRYNSNGYGYVGINPKFVPDVEVRRAIMMAMNPSTTITDYYTADWAEVIYRPISKESWAYPDVSTQHPNVAFTTSAQTINALIQDAGYSLNSNDIWEKDGKALKLTFTIAGGSAEHPAFQMFKDAEEFLEAECHFDITVTTDIQALKKLATGNLAVWAAAWTSSVDPDMYQVYHKDSKATSVKNWNYGEIVINKDNKWGEELAIVEELSDLIDLGRTMTDPEDRAPIYADALDLIMELAVELPTYQRKDYEVYNKKFVDGSTLNKNPTAFASLIDRIWEVNFN